MCMAVCPFRSALYCSVQWHRPYGRRAPGCHKGNVWLTNRCRTTGDILGWQRRACRLYDHSSSKGHGNAGLVCPDHVTVQVGNVQCLNVGGGLCSLLQQPVWDLARDRLFLRVRQFPPTNINTPASRISKSLQWMTTASPHHERGVFGFCYSKCKGK
jgi:hypothetical protein